MWAILELQRWTVEATELFHNVMDNIKKLKAQVTSAHDLANAAWHHMVGIEKRVGSLETTVKFHAVNAQEQTKVLDAVDERVVNLERSISNVHVGAFLRQWIEGKDEHSLRLGRLEEGVQAKANATQVADAYALLDHRVQAWEGNLLKSERFYDDRNEAAAERERALVESLQRQGERITQLEVYMREQRLEPGMVFVMPERVTLGGVGCAVGKAPPKPITQSELGQRVTYIRGKRVDRFGTLVAKPKGSRSCGEQGAFVHVLFDGDLQVQCVYPCNLERL